MELRNAVQTQTAFQILTIKKTKVESRLSNAIEYFLSGPSMTVTRKGVLKPHSDYKWTLEMYLMEWNWVL